jgi:transcriptional regulator with XRE-family HTH domain
MTQAQLAEAAGLGLSTIVDFEKSRRYVSEEAVSALKSALERAGIQFIAENGGGPGVRFKKRQTATKGAAPASYGSNRRVET